MPLMDSNLQSTWEELYHCPMDDGTIAYFERRARYRILGNDHWALKNALNLQPGQTIVLVGGAFGWVAEEWISAGLGPIAVIDTSTWIQSNKAMHATVEIMNEDGATSASRGRIRQALGLTGAQQADWAISEDVIPLLSDAEVPDFIMRLRVIGTTVAHWVSVGQPADGGGWAGNPKLNWKTLEDWKALVTPDLVVQRGTDRVL